MSATTSNTTLCSIP